MSGMTALSGAIRYEFAMQGRRLAVWIAFGLLSLLVFAAGLGAYLDKAGTSVFPGGPIYTRGDIIIEWTITCQFILTVGAALLLADRFRRDNSTRVSELLRTAPAPIWSRLIGKYLGSVLATLLPIFVIYSIGVGAFVARWQDIRIIPLALATFAALVIPPVLFVGAYTIACTTVLWSPLYIFLFVGYWLWASLNPGEAIPTISGTLLAPSVSYVIRGFFHFAAFYPQDEGFYPQSSVGLGIAHIAVLLGLGAIGLIVAWCGQVYVAAHR